MSTGGIEEGSLLCIQCICIKSYAIVSVFYIYYGKNRIQYVFYQQAYDKTIILG